MPLSTLLLQLTDSRKLSMSASSLAVPETKIPKHKWIEDNFDAE